MNILMEEHGGSAAQSCPQGSALFSVFDENNAIVLVTLTCSSTVSVQPLLLSSLSQVLALSEGVPPLAANKRTVLMHYERELNMLGKYINIDV